MSATPKPDGYIVRQKNGKPSPVVDTLGSRADAEWWRRSLDKEYPQHAPHTITEEFDK